MSQNRWAIRITRAPTSRRAVSYTCLGTSSKALPELFFAFVRQALSLGGSNLNDLCLELLRFLRDIAAEQSRNTWVPGDQGNVAPPVDAHGDC